MRLVSFGDRGLAGMSSDDTRETTYRSSAGETEPGAGRFSGCAYETRIDHKPGRVLGVVMCENIFESGRYGTLAGQELTSVKFRVSSLDPPPWVGPAARRTNQASADPH